jgi:pimeloyl-ACP methyl ester carboxylesterase
VIVERGKDPSRLDIVFSGAYGNLSVRPFDFYDITTRLGHSRILLRDPARLWYQKGVGGGIDDFSAVVDLLRREIDRLRPERVVVFGNSMGGFASLLAGHLLGADTVHAFGPQISIHPLRVVRHREDELFRDRGRDLLRLSLQRAGHLRWFDLPRALRCHNGTTRHHVHVCADTPSSRDATLLRGRPGLDVLTYPNTTKGQVVLELARGGYLLDLLTLPSAEGVRDLHADRFGTAVQ